jgi:hypothetical protein
MVFQGRTRTVTADSRFATEGEVGLPKDRALIIEWYSGQLACRGIELAQLLQVNGDYARAMVLAQSILDLSMSPTRPEDVEVIWNLSGGRALEARGCPKNLVMPVRRNA